MTSLLLQSPPKNTRWFIRRLQRVSPGNLRALWLPHSTDTTTNILKPDGRTWTNSASIAGRITYQGNGILVSFNGTDQYVTAPDATNLTFIEPNPFSLAWFGNITDTAATRYLFNKYASGFATREWALVVNANDTMTVLLYDQSAGAQPSRSTSTAVSQGSPTLVGVTYDGGGGATAADGITFYEKGAVKTSTASNSGTYVAMEDTATDVYLMARGGSDATPGTCGFAAIFAAALTASQHAQIASICRRYYRSAL